MSTQQILHPDDYFSRLKPTQPKLPDPGKHRGYHTLVDGEVGELDHTILLRQYAGKEASETLAPKWRSGLYRILERKDRGAAILLYASDWQSPEAAQKFFRAYRKVLRGKWKKMDVETDTDTELSGRGDDGRFQVLLKGTNVTSAEGL